jgi:cytochrome P450
MEASRTDAIAERAPRSEMREATFQPGAVTTSTFLDPSPPQQRNYEFAQRDVVELESGFVMAASREAVDEALKLPMVFSSEGLIDLGNIRPMLPLSVDPPNHLKYRKILDPLFAPKQMDAIEEDVAARVNHFIDEFVDGGYCNFTTELAEMFPSSVFLGLMGLPWDELEMFLRLRDGLLRPGKAHSTQEERLAFQRATALEVYDYFDSILDQRLASPRDDILSLFNEAEVEGDRLTREEILDICFLFLTAGLDTVTDSLTCFFAFLAQHDEHRRQIVERPELIPNAVEELLRWETPVPMVIRVAKESCPVMGHEVPAGALLSVNIAAANVDPAECPEPLEVRFDRDVNRHLAFGGGVHRCLGSHLARRELRVALREWHRRIPEYSLAPGYEVTYQPPLRFVPNLQLVWER